MFPFIHIGKKLNSYDLSEDQKYVPLSGGGGLQSFPRPALSTLSGLASCGRLVGVISHVAELKGRIDRQILAEKGRAYGSTVRLKC